jgi:predicted nucleic acid-binding Zn ribbon protein
MFRLFHKHTWSTPHPIEGDEGQENPEMPRYVMRCYDCGAEREVQTTLSASTEVRKRAEEARKILQKLNTPA